MSDLDMFYQNCLEVRARILSDPELQARIKEIMDKRLWKEHGESASYAPLEGTGLGVKRRHNLSYDPEIELVVTAHLWAPTIPVSRLIVVVRQEGVTMHNKGKDETYKALTYLVEDFGTTDDHYNRLEAERIIEHARTRGIELSRLAIRNKKHTEQLVIYDLDPGASFTGDFDKNAYALLRGNNPAYKQFRDIRDKLLSPEFSLAL